MSYFSYSRSFFARIPKLIVIRFIGYLLTKPLQQMKSKKEVKTVEHRRSISYLHSLCTELLLVLHAIAHGLADHCLFFV